jgi:Low molecular weight phosphotyrosine protein phosphatase
VGDIPEVLFVCTHNAGRSQMAATLLDHEAAGRVRVTSAGSQPASQLNPAVVATMAEIGLDISREFPKPLTAGKVQAADIVITMGSATPAPSTPASATSTGICPTLPGCPSSPSGRSATKSDGACSPCWPTSALLPPQSHHPATAPDSRGK